MNKRQRQRAAIRAEVAKPEYNGLTDAQRWAKFTTEMISVPRRHMTSEDLLGAIDPGDWPNQAAQRNWLDAITTPGRHLEIADAQGNPTAIRNQLQTLFAGTGTLTTLQTIWWVRQITREQRMREKGLLPIQFMAPEWMRTEQELSNG